MNELSEINGTILSAIYRNDENGYAVVKIEQDNGETFTAVGCLPYISAGEMISAEGTWVSHSQYGKQFKIEQSNRLLPSSAEGIYEYLAGGSVKGIGPATAALIVDRFGENSLDVLEQQPEKLAEVRGMGLSKAKRICAEFKKQSCVRRLTEFLCAYGISPLVGLRLYKMYGDRALRTVQNNPYIIAGTSIGGSFAEADGLALELGVEGDSINRLRAGVLYELRHNALLGHCFVPKNMLCAATAQMLRDPELNIEPAVDSLEQDGSIVCDKVTDLDACYLSELFYAETEVSSKIKSMAARTINEKPDTDGLIKKLEGQFGISYAPMQRRAIELAVTNQILVITGGPGTGKTTILKGIISIFDEMGLETALAAPTGRAAKRMSELSGKEASTIHRLLGAKMSEDNEDVVFTKDETDPLDCDALVVDECSMVDIILMSAIVSAIKPECRLILVGDANQLPSVGPGKVFADIIRSEKVPTIILTEIFRQKADSFIVRNAHMINAGKHPELNANRGDFFRLRRLQGGSMVETIIELCTKRLPEKMHIQPSEIQVLSPTRKGEAGTVNLNKCLQAALNPPSEGKNEKPFGDIIFRVGDRVIQTRNNYDTVWKTSKGKFGYGVYNGDIGIISSIDFQTESLNIDFDDRLAAYSFDMLNEIEHAWALTVHKSQGSEYRAVILSLSDSVKMLLTRGVLYTAVTRAKELLIMVGDENVAYRMIDNEKKSNRFSALRLRMISDEN